MSKCKICNVECPSTFCDDCSKMVGQGITALTADRDKWRDRCKRLVEHYGASSTWASWDRYSPMDVYAFEENGYDFAQQIQREIDDDAK